MTDKHIAIEPILTSFALSLPMPGSKSYANRAIIAACLSQGSTTIHNATPCDDVTLMVENLQKMGFALTWANEQSGELHIQGGIPTISPSKNDGYTKLDCRNAGTTLRFLTSLACIVPGRWEITGSERMRHRPVGDLVRALQSLGAQVEATGDCPPLRIQGGTLRGGSVALDASKSSQFLSALLLIAPVLSEGLHISLTSTLASPSYVDLTENILKTFGVKITHNTETNHESRITNYDIRPGKYTSPGTLAIEGDWSAAGAWLVLSMLTGSSVDYTNLDPQSLQGDRMFVDGLRMLMEPGDFTVDCTDLPDQVMNLALFAAFRKGTTIITGAKNLRLKECDRLQVITQELRKAGIDIAEQDDGLIIRGLPRSQIIKLHSARLPSSPIRSGGSKTSAPAEDVSTGGNASRQCIMLDPHDDHRMAMVFGVLGCIVPGISVKDPGCVSKSYPRFFQDLAAARSHGKPIVIVGMRGSGKSSLARRLGAKKGLPVLDVDAQFVARHGPIADFVKEHNWEAFRAEEERIIAECVKPGCIVALGGGAVESAHTRVLLKERAIVIWMQMSERGTIERLTLTKRPPLTDLPLEQEVPQVLARRDPLYRELATIILPERTPFSAHISFVIRELLAYTASYDPLSRRFSYRSDKVAPGHSPRRRSRR